MSTEYRFSLTPRLIGLALFGGVALMVLLFALGYQVGRGMAAGGREEGRTAAAEAAGARLLRKADTGAADAVSPLKKALQ
ncbi:hypothetical protein HH212_17295 [Massilia forsythiae]|uniref:Uncharacterized protein n=1 Tax=Massilia forsythiae TaxID=2728020 RepID=A0A7Z2ZQM9_9BURK|nr:hypothetical protein [Massilia forsythiae]QJD98615.1 hypothetical protein HH212_17295 [Massilia forsythiae]